MELELFDFIENTMNCYDSHLNSYFEAEKELRLFFENLAYESGGAGLGIHSRVKSRNSLREKLIRNKYYLDYETAEDALHAMPDIVGITIECRFIRNEAEMYKYVVSKFIPNRFGYAVCINRPQISLNLHMAQPQMMRNGYAIYRIDGNYELQGEIISFELQIKSLVHKFWSEIEHEIVYKNQEMFSNDSFLKSMLGSVRDSLDVMDRQMEIIYEEIRTESKETTIGMNEKSFKLMVASSINEIVNKKMKESVGYATDFRKDAGILSQYIYLRYFVNGDNNEARMVEFLEHLNFLAESNIDFRSQIVLEEEYRSNSVFETKLVHYWLSKINADFEWHALFSILVAIQNSNNIESISDFAQMIHMLVIQPNWYRQQFKIFGEDQNRILDSFEELFADSLVKANTIHSIHEDYLFEAMKLFHSEIERLSKQYVTIEMFEKDKDEIYSNLSHRMDRIFH